MLWPRYVSSSTLASLCQLPGSCVEMPGLQTWEIFGWLVSLAKADWERMRLAIDPIILYAKMCCAFISLFVNYDAFVTLAKISVAVEDIAKDWELCYCVHWVTLKQMKLLTLIKDIQDIPLKANKNLNLVQKLKTYTYVYYYSSSFCGELIFSNIIESLFFVGSVTMSPIPMMIWSPALVRPPQALGATASWLLKNKHQNTLQIFG